MRVRRKWAPFLPITSMNPAGLDMRALPASTADDDQLLHTQRTRPPVSKVRVVIRYSGAALQHVSLALHGACALSRKQAFW